MKITVSKLDRPIRVGDWHDQPHRWAANGPGNEVQTFPRKAEATLWASARRKADSYQAASRLFSAEWDKRFGGLKKKGK